MVLASNAENVLLPINEPTYGTRRRSQIETYLVSNGGEGVQHIALFTDDVFRTVRTFHRLPPPSNAVQRRPTPSTASPRAPRVNRCCGCNHLA